MVIVIVGFEKRDQDGVQSGRCSQADLLVVVIWVENGGCLLDHLD